MGPVLLVALLAACSSKPTAFAEAEALEAQGKLAESGDRFESVCAAGPTSEVCAPSSARAAAVRLKAADKALEAGQLAEAVRLLRLARLTGDEATAKSVDERLARAELTEGLRYERALREADKQEAARAMTAIAASSASAATKAKAWLEREKPATLVEAVRAACGPDHVGSCSQSWAALQALPTTPPGFDEAAALAREEERRVYPLRVEAERFLPIFAERHKKKEAFERCVEEHKNEPPRGCRESTWDKDGVDRYDNEKNEENLFRRRLIAIADPELVKSLSERQKQALDSGTVTNVTIPKPAAAKK